MCQCDTSIYFIFFSYVVIQVASVYITVNPGDYVKKGDEIGHFELVISTPILCFDVSSSLNLFREDQLL